MSRWSDKLSHDFRSVRRWGHHPAGAAGCRDVTQVYGTDVAAMFGPMARPAAHDPERAWDGDHYHTVTYLQWNDHEGTPTQTMRAGTLGSLPLDHRSVSEPARSQPRGRLAAFPTAESPSR